MAIVHAQAEPGSLEKTNKVFFEGNTEYRLFRWKQSGAYEIFCTNLDMVINAREASKCALRVRIRTAWTAVLCPAEFKAQLKSEGIDIDSRGK
jgi:hypothetical protein